MIKIHIDQKGARADTVEKMVTALLQAKWPDAELTVERYDPPSTRPARFSEAQSEIGSAKSTAETLRDELQDWRDGLPENLQDGEKANQLDEAISNLDEFIESLDTAENVEIEFPQMMG